jgi:hypothetical protein
VVLCVLLNVQLEESGVIERAELMSFRRISVNLAVRKKLNSHRRVRTFNIHLILL